MFRNSAYNCKVFIIKYPLFISIFIIDDVNISVLTAQMEILQVLLKDGDYFCFDDIIVKIKELPNPEPEMIKEVITLCKLNLVNPATSAAQSAECSRLKILFDCPEAKNMAPFKNEPGTIQ